MGDANAQRSILKTTTGAQDASEREVAPKGLCHVTFFKASVSSLILPCEKQNRFPALFSYDFFFLGVIRDDLFYLFF